MPYYPLLGSENHQNQTTMGKFINPFTDIGFKHIFGREISKDVLIAFLNDLLVGERHIADISFMDKEDMPEMANGRVVIFDILCRETNGAYFIIEMQNQYQDFFLDRSLYYLCRSVTRQGIKGKDWEYEIFPVYGIYFLNFIIPPFVSFRTDVILADRATGEAVNRKFRQIYLSMPYFTLEQDECKTDFERWIYILKHMDTFDRMPFNAQKAVFDKLLDIADVSKLDEKERARYDEALKIYRDYYGTINSAKRQGRKEGEEKGRAEGLAEGIEKGKVEGKAEGLAEGKAKLRTAAHGMKDLGIPIENIAKITGLTPEEIETA